VSDPLLMLVDDAEELREAKSLIIEAHGFRTSGASDGLEALAKLESNGRPALILLDVRMPRMNGVEFLRLLSGTPRATIPVLALTGDTNACRDAIDAGAVGCLQKPIEPGRLLDAIRAQIGASEEARA
jgi:two-component system OmpR family response regulator